MRIKSIEIRNYRQYRSLSYSFDNTVDKSHDLQIIIAQNGVGKSNFLNAITWCLYEKESHLQSKYKALPIPNTAVIEETSNKGEIKVRVSIVVDVDGEDQTITREAIFVRNDVAANRVMKKNSKITVSKKTYDAVLGLKVPMVHEGEYAENLINKLFPEGINQYFFFDNEQMNNYFTSNDGAAIKNAINSISRVTLIQSVNSRLKYVQNEYRVNLGASDTKIKNLKQQYDDAKKAYEAEEKELADVNNDIKEAELRITELNELIGSAGNLNLLEKNRDLLLKNREKFKNEADAIEKELSEFIVRYETLINMYPAILKTLQLIEEKDRQRQLPPDITADVMRKSIAKCTCELCQNQLDEKHIKLIQEKIDAIDLTSPVYSMLLSIRYKLQELKTEAEQYTFKKQILLTKRSKKHDEMEDNENELNNIINQMKSISDQDKIKEYIDEREQLEPKADKLHEAKGTIQARVSRYKKDMEEIDDKITAEIKAQAKNNYNAAVSGIVKELIDVTTKAENEIIAEIRQEISKQTFDNFKNLIWKENTYANIVIDHDYNVDLIHNKGYSAIGSTSAAERALLALSFTNAIHSVSGFDSPLVIDSPVGRVSDINRKKFAETLAEISKSKQIIMLFTPDEYSDDVSSVFDGIANKARAYMNSDEDETKFK